MLDLWYNAQAAVLTGRASEVHACSVGEQQQILVVSLAEAPVVSGV